VPFILNDRPDLAAEIGADGVHVGQDDMSPEESRRLVGDDALLGLSTHGVSDLDRALGVTSRGADAGGAAGPATSPSTGSRAPVDYISAGPVVPTPTKPGRAGTGLGYVGLAGARAPWSVWVTGGVGPASVEEMAAAGARHFVVVRWLTEAADPRTHAARLRGAIDDAVARAGDGSPGS
jgi:thiamine-phosphate pyrophosphorylase